MRAPLLSLFVAASLLSSCSPSELCWPEIKPVHKPWSYWWWMGSAVDRGNLTRHLEAFYKAGMGGIHIIPIYGVKGREKDSVDFLSSEWMERAAYTVREAKRLGMGVDLSTGTGWPFGGPWVRESDADAKVILKTYTIKGGTHFRRSFKEGAMLALMAFSDKGERMDLTAKVDEKRLLDWTAPEGVWDLYGVSQEFSGRRVKRAAPGGEGYSINPYSFRALQNYLRPFDLALSQYPRGFVRAHYHDSFEYLGNWTDDLFEEFLARRGYDLRQHLPALFGRASEDRVARVKSDYRECISDLLLEDFTIPWVDWVHKMGSIARNEAHGSPGNLLDLYAAADIPETETFGPTGFPIPGLRVDPDYENAPPDPLVLKFASSAAHVSGKVLASCESCTWLGEHFKVALSQVKPEIDQLFAEGINHIFYHGTTYSPADEPWPGWLFYASTNFGSSNTFWRDLPELNAYIARCQSILQSGEPANDFLLYFPIHDVWHNKEGLLTHFSVHNLQEWLAGGAFYHAAETLWKRGYAFDYISDRLLQSLEFSSLGEGGSSFFSKKAPGTPSPRYRTIVIPQCMFFPLRTLGKLIDLARTGGTIIFQGGLPSDVPGLGNLEKRREEFSKVLADLETVDSGQAGVKAVKIGQGRFLVGMDLEGMLAMEGISPEPLAQKNIRFCRRTHPNGHHYFLANLGDRNLDGWVILAVKAESAVLMDPLSGKTGMASIVRKDAMKTGVYLQLKPGQSCILRTFSSGQVENSPWRYLQEKDTPRELRGTWEVAFLEGGPKLPGDFKTEVLASWTDLGGEEAKSFAGTARYSISFEKPPEAADEWILDLGRVCESARVSINGRFAGMLWSIPFRIPVRAFLREGKNVLEVEVVNLPANRIADMDRRKVYWKKFHDINFVNIRYKNFNASRWPVVESGLLGPVRLIPADFMVPQFK